jgi:DNA-binding transcriptional LysR family regulator
MSRSEWLRTFVAVYRTGSVTVGARSRGLSQPAASQQLAALARAVGGPVVSRGPGGVLPTARGRELYAQVAEPLDRLEDVLADLDGGRLRRRDRPVRPGPATAAEGRRAVTTIQAAGHIRGVTPSCRRAARSTGAVPRELVPSPAATR